MQKKIILCSAVGILALFPQMINCAIQAPQKTVCRFVESYAKPAEVTDEVWSAVLPYLLPADHPAKQKLDKIFSASRATASSKDFKKAGFVLLDDKEQDLIVATHPAIPGYIVKIYYDNHRIADKPGVPGDAQYWINRMIGMQRVRKSIEKNNLGNLFVVPNKWIYPLPDKPQPPCKGLSNCYPKHFILVSEQVDLVSNEENAKLYKEIMTPKLLEGLYTIMKEAHLYDSIYIDNNIFMQDGRIAFIDTEDFDRKPILFHEMTVYLSPEMQRFWMKLLAERGATIPPRICERQLPNR